ncbi:hypothetical protein [Butyrivibrio sp. YAB3001]|uniref:hypothetical protein n=1 Tax=Butyrivibrio sp. YAB3001 TaxID=1520812 RepID=UPI0008F688F0|nr:hypothetical protein [Butyrivibrio sp. YAB3001]SFC77535.1 hypothetical protein SAMN02910398_03119 [Butyrivibrio sp. YAB3001]
MKSKLLNVFKVVVFSSIIAACIFGAAAVVRRKDSSYKYADFFQEAKKNNIDVLLMGSSHVINGINPLTLYEDYGYTSYNMAGHGSVMQSTYWELIEALDYCSPKWVVVDAYMLEKNYQYLDVMEENAGKEDINTSVDQLHLNMDAWPLNKLKIAAVSDLIKDPSIRNEFLFDFIVYHSRWNELTEADYKAFSKETDRNRLFGAEMRYGVELSPVVYPDPGPERCLDEHTVGQEYLMKIIDECQRRGIGIVVTYLPFCATTEDRIAANTAGVVAGMYDVPYLNMLDAGIINLYTDLNDRGHLNAVGAKKVTEYLGRWLYENADLSDHRGEAGYEYYDKCAIQFDDENIKLSVSGDSLYDQLEMLSRNSVSSVIYLNQNSAIFGDDNLKELIANISGTDKIWNTNGPYILINDVESQRVYEASDGEMLDGVETGLGTLVYQPVEQLFRLLYAKENEEFNYLYDDEHAAFDIQIITYDRNTGEVISHQYYRPYGHQYRTD